MLPTLCEEFLTALRISIKAKLSHWIPLQSLTAAFPTPLGQQPRELGPRPRPQALPSLVAPGSVSGQALPIQEQVFPSRLLPNLPTALSCLTNNTMACSLFVPAR